MSEDRKPTTVHDVTTTYRVEPGTHTDAERAWIDLAIDKGLASPPILDRSVQEIMADIWRKNRAKDG